MVAISADHLARHFGQRVVLRDVTFTLLQGSSLGITGANGSGKTVLLRLLGGLDRPTSGRAWVHGSDTTRQASHVRRRVGYVPEDPALYDGVTAQQYLTFVARARGLGAALRAASVDTLVQVVGLEDRRYRQLSNFSPGERRRLALAAALLHEPDVILLDDPLRSLDGQARVEQMEVLRELKQLGASLLMTATRPEDVLEVCDSVALLRDGVVAWQGDRLEAERLAAPFGQDAGDVRVRAEILEGVESALTLLRQRGDVRELEAEPGPAGTTLWFLFQGDRPQLAALLPQLVRAGSSVAHFGVEQRSAAGALAARFRS